MVSWVKVPLTLYCYVNKNKDEKVYLIYLESTNFLVEGIPDLYIRVTFAFDTIFCLKRLKMCCDYMWNPFYF